jgi:hypothetical protein
MRYKTVSTAPGRLSPGLAIVAGVVLMHSAAASELKPMQTYSVNHGEQTIVVFYTEAADGAYEVVTTIGAVNGSVPSVQYNSTLMPGQQQRINFANASQSVLKIDRADNTVTLKVIDGASHVSMTD